MSPYSADLPPEARDGAGAPLAVPEARPAGGLRGLRGGGERDEGG